MDRHSLSSLVPAESRSSGPQLVRNLQPSTAKVGIELTCHIRPRRKSCRECWLGRTAAVDFCQGESCESPEPCHSCWHLSDHQVPFMSTPTFGSAIGYQDCTWEGPLLSVANFLSLFGNEMIHRSPTGARRCRQTRQGRYGPSLDDAKALYKMLKAPCAESLVPQPDA